MLAVGVALVVAAGPSRGSVDVSKTSCFIRLNGEKGNCYTADEACSGCGKYWCDNSATVCVEEQSSGKQRHWLFASEGNTPLAYARPVRPGRWNVTQTNLGRTFQGFIARRDATARWEIHNRKRLVGYAKGPDPAVVGLFVLCNC